LDGSSLLLINDFVAEVRAKVTSLVADQYPDMQKPLKDGLQG
jgi:hypothetical protein